MRGVTWDQAKQVLDDFTAAREADGMPPSQRAGFYMDQLTNNYGHTGACCSVGGTAAASTACTAPGSGQSCTALPEQADDDLELTKSVSTSTLTAGWAMTLPAVHAGHPRMILATDIAAAARQNSRTLSANRFRTLRPNNCQSQPTDLDKLRSAYTQVRLQPQQCCHM